MTTREPHADSDESRFVFAVFLVDESHEGDNRDAGYVTTNSEWKIELTPTEAHKILFWNYYINQNAPQKIVFGSGFIGTYLTNRPHKSYEISLTVKSIPEEKEFAQHFSNTSVRSMALMQMMFRLSRVP